VVNINIMEYYETINLKFPKVLFQWTFLIPGEDEVKFSKPKPFDFKMFNKKTIYRTALDNETEREFRADLDYSDFNQNLTALNKLKTKLNKLKIKYLCYFTGGKGVHLTFRYITPTAYKDISSAELNKLIWEYLDLDLNIDKTLFRSYQMIGAEGFTHRKTRQPKVLLDDNNLFTLEQINILYLTNLYLNELPKDFLKQVKTKPLQVINTPTKPFKTNNKNQEHMIKRFIIVHNLLKDGHKRLNVMFSRFLYINYSNNQTELNKIITHYKSKTNQDNNNKLDLIIKDEFKRLENKEVNTIKIFIFPELITPKDFFNIK